MSEQEPPPPPTKKYSHMIVEYYRRESREEDRGPSPQARTWRNWKESEAFRKSREINERIRDARKSKNRSRKDKSKSKEKDKDKDGKGRKPGTKPTESTTTTATIDTTATTATTGTTTVEVEAAGVESDTAGPSSGAKVVDTKKTKTKSKPKAKKTDKKKSKNRDNGAKKEDGTKDNSIEFIVSRAWGATEPGNNGSIDSLYRLIAEEDRKIERQQKRRKYLEHKHERSISALDPDTDEEFMIGVETRIKQRLAKERVRPPSLRSFDDSICKCKCKTACCKLRCKYPCLKCLFRSWWCCCLHFCCDFGNADDDLEELLKDSPEDPEHMVLGGVDADLDDVSGKSVLIPSGANMTDISKAYVSQTESAGSIPDSADLLILVAEPIPPDPPEPVKPDLGLPKLHYLAGVGWV